MTLQEHEQSKEQKDYNIMVDFYTKLIDDEEISNQPLEAIKGKEDVKNKELALTLFMLFYIYYSTRNNRKVAMERAKWSYNRFASKIIKQTKTKRRSFWGRLMLCF